MSLLILSPETVWNTGQLEFRSAPQKILRRGTLLLRRGAGWRLRFRALVENEFFRYTVTLSPFLAVGFIWPALALPLGSAPIFMLVAVGVVEMRMLRIPRNKRHLVMDEDEAARVLDTLHFRGRRVLAELAALRQIESGRLYLVVEQSELARIRPLTLASLQLDEGKSRLVPLNSKERAVIANGLFYDAFTEDDLLRANQRENVFMRSVTFEAQGVSAHARLAAFLEATATPEATPA